MLECGGHDTVVSKGVQDLLALQTPVQAEFWLVLRTAPSASGAKDSIREIIVCPTSAFHKKFDVRAPLPARLAFAEGPHDHNLVDVGVRISSLLKNNVLDPELVAGKRRHEGLLVSRMQEGHDLLDPVAPPPIQEDGDIWKIGFRASSIFSSRNEEGP